MNYEQTVLKTYCFIDNLKISSKKFKTVYLISVETLKNMITSLHLKFKINSK